MTCSIIKLVANFDGVVKNLIYCGVVYEPFYLAIYS